MKGIHFKYLSKQFGGVQALSDINLAIDEGEFVALIGPSGCGKTTMLRLSLGLEQATSGEVCLGGAKPEDARRAQELGFVFQKAALVPSITTLANIELTVDITKSKTGQHLDPLRMLDDFGLGQFKDHYPHQLSGGMQQRVNIAAAMVHNPHYLFMDEPFGALDEMTRESMAEWLEQVLMTKPKTVILVTHSIEEAVMMADRVVILAPRPGRIDSIVNIDLPRPRRKQIKTQQAFADLVMDVRTKLYNVERLGGHEHV